MVNINGEVADTIMGQTVPTDSTPGPLYAEDIANNLLYHVAPHTHTGPGNLDGYQLGAESLDITSDINFNTTNLNSLRSARFTSQSSSLVGSQDLNSIYVVNGNLFYNNNDGYAVQITTNNTIIDVSNFLTSLTPVSITNPVVPFVIPSSATYNLLEISSSTNAVTITLPIASTVSNGRFYFFQDVGGVAETNNVTIQVAGGSGNLIYNSSNAGATSVVLADQNFGGYIYSNGSNNWHIQLFSTLTYNTETITFAGTSDLVIDSALTVGPSGVVTVDGGGAIVFDSGSILHMVNGSTTTLAGTTQITNTGFLEASSGAAVTLNAGVATTLNGTNSIGGNSTFTGNCTFAGVYVQTRLITADYVCDSISPDYFILCNSGSGAITITLPPANTAGRVLIFQGGPASSTPNVVVLQTVSGQLILVPSYTDNGSAGTSASTTYTIQEHYIPVRLISVGSNWNFF